MGKFAACSIVATCGPLKSGLLVIPRPMWRWLWVTRCDVTHWYDGTAKSFRWRYSHSCEEVLVWLGCCLSRRMWPVSAIAAVPLARCKRNVFSKCLGFYYGQKWYVWGFVSVVSLITYEFVLKWPCGGGVSAAPGNGEFWPDWWSVLSVVEFSEVAAPLYFLIFGLNNAVEWCGGAVRSGVRKSWMTFVLRVQVVAARYGNLLSWLLVFFCWGFSPPPPNPRGRRWIQNLEWSRKEGFLPGLG